MDEMNKLGYYRTLGGDSVCIICTDAPGDYPLIGYQVGHDSQSARWTTYGLWSKHLRPHPNDLESYIGTSL